MKYTVLIITSLLLLTSGGCRQKPHDCSGLLKKIETEFDAGNLLVVKKLGDSLKIICFYDKLLISKSDSLSQIAERTALDFPFNGNMIDKQLKEKIGEFTPEEKTEWEKKNWLEWRTIDGEKRYFSRAVSNLVLTFLFMSMLRYKGIPVKWQSGWKVPPDAKNFHDCCEVYFESIGWVPVDVDYGLQYSENRKTREFYISGIDSYSLIINEGVAGRLYPEKKFLRSEPFDFQRGEVEWSGGNLYFNKWDYSMEIIYNK